MQVTHGSHRSDVICSTFEWLKNARVQLEYRKNHDGFWTGELFIKQVILIFFIHVHCSSCFTKFKEKIIPEFEALHGPKYQALIMVDNSQGHGIYAPDALLTRETLQDLNHSFEMDGLSMDWKKRLCKR